MLNRSSKTASVGTRLNEFGFSLLETIIAAGIMMAVVLAFASMMANQAREINAMDEKFSTTELRSMLFSILADGTICKYMVTRSTVPTFNSTRLPSIIEPAGTQDKKHPFEVHMLTYDMNGTPTAGPAIIQIGKPFSMETPNLVPSAIKLEVTSGAQNNFFGKWIIEFNHEKMVRPLRPVEIMTLLQADVTNPIAARLVDCKHAPPPPTPTPTPLPTPTPPPSGLPPRVFPGALGQGDFCPNCAFENKNDTPVENACGTRKRYLVNNDQASIDQRCKELGYKRGVANQFYSYNDWCYYCNARTRRWNGSSWSFGNCVNGNVQQATCYDD